MVEDLSICVSLLKSDVASSELLKLKLRHDELAIQLEKSRCMHAWARKGCISKRNRVIESSADWGAAKERRVGSETRRHDFMGKSGGFRCVAAWNATSSLQPHPTCWIQLHKSNNMPQWYATKQLSAYVFMYTVYMYGPFWNYYLNKYRQIFLILIMEIMAHKKSTQHPIMAPLLGAGCVSFGVLKNVFPAAKLSTDPKCLNLFDSGWPFGLIIMLVDCVIILQGWLITDLKP